MRDQSLSDIARALGHPVRVRIIRLLAEESECRGADVFSSLPLAQSTISQHLRVLRDAGLVASHPVGTGSVYCLVPSVLEEFAREALSLAQSAPACSSVLSPATATKE